MTNCVQPFREQGIPVFFADLCQCCLQTPQVLFCQRLVGVETMNHKTVQMTEILDQDNADETKIGGDGLSID
jgi:hypothetical protein